jgi:DNA-binding transcriptional regulator YiaG
MFLFYTVRHHENPMVAGLEAWRRDFTKRTHLWHGHVKGYEMNTAKVDKVIEPRDIRHKLGLNQQQFWSKIGVTQSGGSRYESGRNMPRPVRELLRLAHVEQIDIQRIKRDDVDIVEFLKSENPEAYKALKKEARAWRKSR